MTCWLTRHRSRPLFAAAVLALVLGVDAGLVSRSLLAEPRKPLTGRVVKIADGDTLTLLVGREEVRVRLHGIDAPEKGQPFGTVARRALADAVFGRDVRVDTQGRDKYGRTLGVIRLEGRDINAQLVKDGMAWAYVHFSRAYVRQEREAREARRGLWRDAQPVAPWEWRSARRPGSAR